MASCYSQRHLGKQHKRQIKMGCAAWEARVSDLMVFPSLYSDCEAVLLKTLTGGTGLC